MLIGSNPGELDTGAAWTRGGVSVPSLAHALKTAKELLLRYQYCCFSVLDRFRPSILHAAAAHCADFKRSPSSMKLLGARKESNPTYNIKNVLCRLHLLILVSLCYLVYLISCELCVTFCQLFYSRKTLPRPQGPQSPGLDSLNGHHIILTVEAVIFR